MNTYSKFCTNVFVAKCPNMHERGEVIIVTSKYGKEAECKVFNLVLERDGYFYYSYVRLDGINAQERAKNRAENLLSYAANAEKKSDEHYKKSNKDSDFLILGEPIKVGHHSEKRHRKAIENAQNQMGKSVELSNKAKEYESRAEYHETKSQEINLSVPESLEYYSLLLIAAEEKLAGIKSGTIPKEHAYTMTYARKMVNELTGKVATAKRLWGTN